MPKNNIIIENRLIFLIKSLSFFHLEFPYKYHHNRSHDCAKYPEVKSGIPAEIIY